MKILSRTQMFWVPLCVALAGCTAGPRPEMAPTQPGPHSGPTTARQPPRVPPDVVEMLLARYPVLREEPAPQPRPRTEAEPEKPPERVREALPEPVLERITGGATYYADTFEGRQTASGIPFRQNQMVAAHRAYPFGTVLRVTNLGNDRSVRVRVVDRGPFGAPRKAQRTVIDLSRRAAEELGYVTAGRAMVRVEVLEWGTGLPRPSGEAA